MSRKLRFILSLVLGLSLAAVTAFLSPGDFLPGWLGTSAIAVPGVYILLTAWKWAGGSRALGWMMAVAMLLRLGGGLAANLLLPVYGHPDSDVEKAGYLFLDAYRRDQEAWDISRDLRESIPGMFTRRLDTDQYGGILAVSAAVYRYLTPDARRISLVILLGAVTYAVGTAFFFAGVRHRWGPRTALTAGWILVLYPDAVFFSSSVMREPFLIGLLGIAMWGVLTWKQHRWLSSAAAVLSLAAMVQFSDLAAAGSFGLLAVLFWLEELAPRSKIWKYGGMAVILAGILIAGRWFGVWLNEVARLDLTLTEAGSGRVQLALEEIGAQWRVPFLTVYGLAQPVLPAAIAAPSTPLWKFVAVYRAVGWYLLAPLLVYAIYSSFRAQPRRDRWVLLVLSAAVLVWLLVSSLRAGGDQWDNPRYRTLLLPFMALLAGWGLVWAREKRDAWLVRWLLVEVIFVGYFTQWYVSRYFQIVKRLPFWEMVVRILVLSALVLASGWLWELWKRWRARTAGPRQPS